MYPRFGWTMFPRFGWTKYPMLSSRKVVAVVCSTAWFSNSDIGVYIMHYAL